MLLTKKILVLVFAAAVGFSLCAQQAPAQVEPRGAKEDAAEKEQRQQTRQRMLDRWGKLRALVRIGDKEKEVGASQTRSSATPSRRAKPAA
jgi:hypothetical protein